MAITCNFIWPFFRFFKPLYLGISPEKILKFLQPQHLLLTQPQRYYMLELGLNRRPLLHLPLSCSLEKRSQRCSYHVPLGSPITKEAPPKWGQNEEAFHQLRGRVKPPPSIKLKKCSQCHDLVSAISNTFKCPSSPDT